MFWDRSNVHFTHVTLPEPHTLVGNRRKQRKSALLDRVRPRRGGPDVRPHYAGVRARRASTTGPAGTRESVPGGRARVKLSEPLQSQDLFRVKAQRRIARRRRARPAPARALRAPP